MEVTSLWMLAGGAAAVALIAGPMVRPNARKRALAKARATGDLSDLVAQIEGSTTLSKADAWDQLFLELWRRYDRELAARLMIEALKLHPDVRILHYWVNQALTIEPELSAEVFTPVFLMDYFKPELAAQCGKCGCKG